MQEQTFQTGTVTLTYAEGPAAGPPLVLLHGGSARWQSFESLIPDLASQWHLYAPDLRGHGKSEWVPRHYRLQDYTDDLIAFLEQQVGEPVNLFGHSLGGIVALMIAGQRPEVVRALVVGDSPLSGESWRLVLEETRDKLVEWQGLAGGQVPLDELLEMLKNAPVEKPGQTELVPMRNVYGEDSPVFAWLATNLMQNDPTMYTALLDGFAETVVGYEMSTLFPNIQCPVLLLQADPAHGGLMSDQEIALAHRYLSNVQHVQLIGVGHALHHTHKEPVRNALVQFFMEPFSSRDQ